MSSTGFKRRRVKCEERKDGITEYWNNGILEYWNVGRMGFGMMDEWEGVHYSNLPIPFFHYSILPQFYSRFLSARLVENL